MVEQIVHCRLCGDNHLETVVDLGVQALSGRFPMIGSPDPPSYPLMLVICQGCGLVQLGHNIPLYELYGEGYGYLSGLNNQMVNHLKDIAHRAEELVSLDKGDIIMDIGCNDGTLLKSYRNPDARYVGFDAGHFQRFYKDTNIVFYPYFFDGYSLKAKVITSIAMFYDLPDPNLFVQHIKESLHPDGIWILEQSYLPAMTSKNAFDTICHEHLEYYGLRQIKLLCDRHELQIFDCGFTDTNGGSFMVFVCHQGNPRFKEREYINRYIEGESRHGFDSGLPLRRMMSRVNSIRESLVDFMVREKQMGRTFHLYGASTKVNVLLQYFGIDYRLVSFAAERNAGKYGCWTPGTHIPIMSEEFSRSCHPDYYLVGPWHFRDGFVNQLQDYLDSGGKLLFPLPVPEIVFAKDGVVHSRPI